MLGRVTFDKENIYLNNTRILGVNDFQISTDLSQTPILAIGQGYLDQISEGERSSNFSLTKFTTSQDNTLINLVDQNISGRFLYQSSNEDLASEWIGISGKISSYEFNCSVGDIPTSTFNFEISSESKFSNSKYSPPEEFSDEVVIVRPGDLILSGSNNLFTNRLQSLTFSFNAPYERLYLLGEGVHGTLSLNNPIEISLNMQFHIDSIGDEFSNFELCQNNFSGVFIFNKCGDEIKKFRITGAKLIDYNLNSSVGESAEFSCTYRTYTDDFNKVKEFFVWQ